MKPMKLLGGGKGGAKSGGQTSANLAQLLSYFGVPQIFRISLHVTLSTRGERNS